MMAVFPASAAAAAAPSGPACTLSGSLSGTASSSLINSSATRLLTVPGGNSGVIRFTNLVMLGDGVSALRVSQNGGAYATISEGFTMAFADADTVLLSAIGALSPGDGAQVTLIDATNGSEIATHGTPQLYRV